MSQCIRGSYLIHDNKESARMAQGDRKFIQADIQNGERSDRVTHQVIVMKHLIQLLIISIAVIGIATPSFAGDDREDRGWDRDKKEQSHNSKKDKHHGNPFDEIRGHLLVSEFTSVLRYDQFTGAFMDVFVSPGSGGLDGASGISFGPDGTLYVASFWGSREILRYNGKTGDFIDVFITAGSGGLGAPNDVTFGPDGNLYVADGFFGTNSVLRYNGKTGDFIDIFATGGGMQQPHKLTFGPHKNLFVGNATTSDVLRYHGDTGLPYPSSGNSGAIFVPGIQGPFNTALAFGTDGDLFVVSGATPDVLRYNGKTGDFIGTFVPNGNIGGATDLIFGPDRNLYITNYFGDSVLRYDGSSGAFLDTFVSPNSGGLSRPSSLTFSISKEQCKKGGWINFGFKSQGQCIQFVNTGKRCRHIADSH
jgi:streptogramin lyase